MHSSLLIVSHSLSWLLIVSHVSLTFYMQSERQVLQAHAFIMCPTLFKYVTPPTLTLNMQPKR